jgi:hypothetical protein
MHCLYGSRVFNTSIHKSRHWTVPGSIWIQSGLRTYQHLCTYIQLYSFLFKFWYWWMYAQLVLMIFRHISCKRHIFSCTLCHIFSCTLYGFVYMYTDTQLYCIVFYSLLIQGSIFSLMIATNVQPKHVVVFTCKIKLCTDCDHASFLYTPIKRCCNCTVPFTTGQSYILMP